MKKKKIIAWAKWLVIAYSAIGIAVYYLQDKIIFHPTPLASDHDFGFKEKYEEINIPFNKTDTTNVVKFFPVDSVAKGVVIYFHGNKDNVTRYEKFIDPFLKNGYEVWMPDYAGYGKSTGAFTEEGAYNMAYEVRKMAGLKYAADSIIVYGKSLGTGIASNLAMNTPNKLLVLETPYASMSDVFSRYMWMYPISRMIKYEFPTIDNLEFVRSPVVIFHGTDDGVIPYKSAAKLQDKLKTTDKFYTIEGASHNTVNLHKTYFAVMDSLLR